MRKLRFFAALFAACENNEPKNDSDNTQTNEAATDTVNDSIDSSDSDTTKIDEVTTDTENGHAWIDLGLSVKWATCNVGATNPEEYGNYYAWGETETKKTKSEYFWDTYKYGSEYDELTKYCTNSSYGKDGFTDGRTTLEAADDAATANWGAKWRMPTDAEWQELIDNCTWNWTKLNGVNGYEVKGSNGNTIFLPAAGYRRYDDYMDRAGGYGDYWSSSLSTDPPYDAWRANFDSGNVCRSDYRRCFGRSVRPVLR